ncbi:MAG: VWA domain-containing protein, partial [Candidatus Acidiferrum sp.]
MFLCLNQNARRGMVELSPTENHLLPSFDFAHPVYLPLLLLVPPLIWSWSRRRKPALRFPAVGEMAVLPRGRARMAQFGGALLRGLALLMLVIALAGPRTPDSRTRIDTEGIAIFFVADVSGSMAERDFSWNGEPISRLEAAKRVFRRFVSGDTISGEGESRFSGRPTDLIGLVTFATRPETVCPLTLNHSTLLKLLDAEQPRSIPGEAETNISDALAVGLARLDIAGTRRKVLVLLTDGEHNVASPQSDWKPRQAASLAASLGIPIYTIDTGGDTSPNMEPRSSDAPGQSSTERRDHAVAA